METATTEEENSDLMKGRNAQEVSRQVQHGEEEENRGRRKGGEEREREERSERGNPAKMNQLRGDGAGVGRDARGKGGDVRGGKGGWWAISLPH